MAIYTITLANEKTGEEIRKKVFLFSKWERNDRPNFDSIIKEMKRTLIKQITGKVLS